MINRSLSLEYLSIPINLLIAMCSEKQNALASAYESRLNERVLLGTENDSVKILLDKEFRPPDKGPTSILIFLSPKFPTKHEYCILL